MGYLDKLNKIPELAAILVMLLLFLGAIICTANWLKYTHLPAFEKSHAREEANAKQLVFLLVIATLFGGLFGYIEGQAQTHWIQVIGSLPVLGFLIYCLVGGTPKRLIFSVFAFFLIAFGTEEVGAIYGQQAAMASSFAALLIFFVISFAIGIMSLVPAKP